MFADSASYEVPIVAEEKHVSAVDPPQRAGRPADPDPRASELEIEVARERTRAAMFGRARSRHDVGRFSLLAPVGRGGMGMVFAAYDPQLDRRIAIKLVRPHQGEPERNAAIRERFLAEARAMAKVSHPHVVAIHEAGTVPDDPSCVYLAMELVDGVTLRRWVEQAPRRWREIVEAHVQAGRGLAAVHRAGLVHRDFKGDNAMVDRDGAAERGQLRVRVMDFGLARSDARATTLDGDDGSSPGTRASGTPGYMAPEQLAGGPVDHRADQYALCVSLYESLWQQRPYDGDASRPREPPRSPVPARVRAAILRGLAQRREERFPDMDALLRELAPQRRGRGLALGLVLGAVAVGTSWLVSTRPPCRDADLGVEDIASPAIAAAIAEAFTATDRPYAARTAEQVDAELQRYAAAWSEERRLACEDTRIAGTQTELRMDRRIRCLERRRREVRALVDALGRADAASVDEALPAIARLTPPTRCGDDAFLDAAIEPPGDPELAARVDALDDELDEARASFELGHPLAAAEQAQGVLDRARDTGFAPVVARARLLVARARVHADEVDDVPTTLREAYFDARRTRQPVEAAWAALDLAGWLATASGESEPARLWLALASEEIEPHGLADLSTHALGIAAAIASSSGDVEAALGLVDRQLAALQAGCAGACVDLAEVWFDRARLLAALGRADEAVADARRGLDHALRRHDPEHPTVARARMRLGETLAPLGHVDEAIAELRTALAILERRLGPDHHDVAIARAKLAQVLTQHERPHEAIALLEQALAAVRGRGLPQLAAGLHHQLGEAYYWAGRLDDAEAAFRTAGDMLARLHPDGHLDTAASLGSLANLAFERGRHTEALDGYTRALALRRALVSGEDPLQAAFLQNIAVSLEKLGRTGEAIVAYEQAVELTREGTLDRRGVYLRVRLATLLRADDHARARALLDDAERRCGALTEEQRAHATCERIAAARAELAG